VSFPGGRPSTSGPTVSTTVNGVTESWLIYGNLGRDLTDACDHFTVDFANLRLSLGTLAKKNAK